MVEITCPQCNYSKSIPIERIPTRTRWVRCPRCGGRFEYVRTEEDVIAEKRDLTPWERHMQLGLWNGIKQTMKAVVFSPTSFFSTMTVTGGWREPLAFGLLVGSIGSMCSFFWDFVISSSGLIKPLWGVSASISSPLLFLVFIVISPLLVTINLLVSSIIIHGLLHVVRAGKSKFEATFRVVAYSQATMVWSIIPLVGGPIGWVWRIIVYIIGLKEIHRTSYGRVILAFAIPFALIGILVAGAFFAIIRLISP